MRCTTVLYACLLLAAVDAKKSSNKSKSGNKRNWYPLSELPRLWEEDNARRDAECRTTPHYICENNKCINVANARCDGINQCEDNSDETNCPAPISPTAAGENPSVHYTTTTAPIELTNISSSLNCVLPEQPEGGRFELGSCQRQCDISTSTSLPLGSFLVYSCNEGYILRGNNISICHRGAWFLPPTCIKICPPLRSESVDFVCRYQGEIVSCKSMIVPGTKATLACKDSYKIPLSSDPVYRELICLEEGEWDRSVFHCIPECGVAAAPVNPLIVNGYLARYGEFPWHVGIYLKTSTGNFDQICGGTLASPNLVISAAHCVYDESSRTVMNASKFAVAAGKYYRPYNATSVEPYIQRSQVKKIDIPERYFGRSGNFAQDIALIRLETRLMISALVKPVCIDWDNSFEREQLQSGRNGKIVGWGRTAAGVPSFVLQGITLPYISYENCIAAVPEDFKGFVTADKFCAGYLNGSSLCNGDSGGGLCFQFSGLWYLRGIVSVAPVSGDSCDNNYYTAFTNIGHFLEWIRAVYLSGG